MRRLAAPPSYTHRALFERARAPGGSHALRRFPPRNFVWEIPKIDSLHAIAPHALHAVWQHVRERYIARGELLEALGRPRRGLEAWEQVRDLPYT